jgi:hypothetical protein
MEIVLIVVTVASLLVAAVMSVIASRTIREERRRSDARVATLAADIRAEDYARTSAIEPAARADLPLRDRDGVTTSGDLFASAHGMPVRSRLPVFVMLGAFLVGTVAALAIVFTGVGAGSSAAIDTRSRQPVAAPVAALELIALGHERDADGLTVRGVLRNPITGAQVRQLTAVVLLFNHDGGFVGSGRAPVQATTLDPGSETIFVVTVPSAHGVERYRVSFRTDEHVVPHVDARS